MCNIGNKHTEFFTQKRGVQQGSSLRPTLFNIYINDLAVQLDQSTAPGLTLLDKNIKFLLYADDLVLLSSTPQGLQQHIDLLENYFISKWGQNRGHCVWVFRAPDCDLGDLDSCKKLFVRNMGVNFDSALKFDKRINSVVRSSFFQLREFFVV